MGEGAYHDCVGQGSCALGYGDMRLRLMMMECMLSRMRRSKVGVVTMLRSQDNENLGKVNRSLGYTPEI